MAPKTCRETKSPHKARRSTVRVVAGALAATVVACSTAPRTGTDAPPGDPAQWRAGAPLPSPSPSPSVDVPFLLSPGSAVQDEQRPFGTRHAYFSPAAWNQLPGWQDDDLTDAWRAFLQSCSALARKPGWEALCGRAARTTAEKSSVRGFFESEFVLYEIRNVDRTPDGVITGYYEPLLFGSRVRQGAYLYPVYGVPADLLTLDVRLWPKSMRDIKMRARVEGRQVIPIADTASPKASYVIDVGGLAHDDRDKKLRLRLDGGRLVPYFTRAEIERLGLPGAPVLAWVDTPMALYSMQIQGSGKVRLPDGRMVRLAYAEQNGHPFNPPVKSGGSAGKERLTTRGLNIELPDGDAEADAAAGPAGTAQRPSTIVDAGPAPLKRGRSAATPAPRSAEVEMMIEQFAGTARKSAASRQARPEPSPNAFPPAMLDRSQAALMPAPTTPSQASPQMLAAVSADPSFVFFREIPDGLGGPIGTLGVPLTAGRSVAVDPRTTPLGFPVFLSTGPAAGPGAVKRLMMAQDTGGAIRGAVRADYFWGFGAEAFARAARMKQSGRMWLLMPRGLQVAARDRPTLTRSAAGVQALPDCVIADDSSCVEDR